MNGFNIFYSETYPMHERFILHSHDNYEIIFFLGGDVNYVVEGVVYPLQPRDMILVRPHEMHRAYHKSNTLYTRVIMNLEKKFFENEDCLCYRDVFLNRSAGTKNYISSDMVEKSGIAGLFTRLKAYTDNFSNFSVPVTHGIILELLHILNNNDIYEPPHTSKVQEIIAYINSNYQSTITLESISRSFYISKPYLSRIFRKSTGYTVNGYIKHKRLLSVREKYMEGMTLGNACMESGFNDYTSFYRALRKENGISPRQWIQESIVNP